MNMWTSCRHVNISPCLWLHWQLVTEVPVGIWIRDEFKLKIDRSVKTPWQEYGVVAGSWWWAPVFTVDHTLEILSCVFKFICRSMDAVLSNQICWSESLLPRMIWYANQISKQSNVTNARWGNCFCSWTSIACRFYCFFEPLRIGYFLICDYGVVQCAAVCVYWRIRNDDLMVPKADCSCVLFWKFAILIGITRECRLCL